MGDAVPPGHLTQLLQRWQAGDAGSLDQLVSEIYPELRAMASRYLRGGRGNTIQATMLVHDLYVRLLKQERANFPNRRAFFGFASGVMRHILIDHVRAARTEKRGADRVRVPLTEDLQLADSSPAFLLDLDEALTTPRLRSAQGRTGAALRLPRLRSIRGRRSARHLTGHGQARLPPGTSLAVAAAADRHRRAGWRA